ncbi:dihydropteroate synthase [Pararhizobium mangrovi]|uniref:Dihydropteroate synthase n=1 Tax=Pararhizobium mangrovi TaxID=2590452 RepID=A0A506UC03_9HYPH|nr:dihydropteroate synthase [Pararhizobium mangrovi]TPW31953.1 dihydropteroate synthase [Pararhizobium mangrovi]
MKEQVFAPRIWHLAHERTLTLGPKALVMGIVNATPDSFSDGGRFATTEAAVEAALRMAEAGADILDIGGESTRPGAEPVSAEAEQARILPVIEGIAAQTPTPISVDTYRGETARRAIEAGAHIVNDVWGFQRDPQVAEIAAAMGAACVVMHNGRERERMADVVEDQYAYLDRSLEIARNAGLADTAIVLDPGFGFAKTAKENVALMRRFGELHRFGLPLLVGPSRKRFLGALTGRAAGERDQATAAVSVALRLAGAAIFRVHDVAANRDALAVADAIVADDEPALECQGEGES